jgi:deoxyuridine 5'-triphosphate nucleotidohydrolase
VLARGSATVRTGIAVAIPKGYYGRVASRSGLSVKHSLEVGAGVVDAAYRGEIMVRLHNHGDANVFLAAGDRIAQLVVTAIYTGDVEEAASLDDTDRGDRGFGSSGK